LLGALTLVVGAEISGTDQAHVVELLRLLVLVAAAV